MIGIILHDIIKKYVLETVKVFIKWPNDIYLNNKKVCGILIEFLSYGNNIRDILIGIGVNTNNSPRELYKSSTFLKKYSNISFDNIEIVESILHGIDYWAKVLDNNKNLILREWMQRSTKLNSIIKFHLNNKIVSGVYKGIANDGAIKVLINDKKNSFYNLELL